MQTLHKSALSCEDDTEQLTMPHGQLARLLVVSPRTLSRMSATGLFPIAPFVFDGRPRYSVPSIRAWLADGGIAPQRRADFELLTIAKVAVVLGVGHSTAYRMFGPSAVSARGGVEYMADWGLPRPVLVGAEYRYPRCRLFSYVNGVSPATVETGVSVDDVHAAIFR